MFVYLFIYLFIYLFSDDNNKREEKLESIRTLFHSIYIEQIGFQYLPPKSTNTLKYVGENIGGMLGDAAAKMMSFAKWPRR